MENKQNTTAIANVTDPSAPERYSVGNDRATLDRTELSQRAAREFSKQIGLQMAGKRYAAAIRAGLLELCEVPRRDKPATKIELRAAGVKVPTVPVK